MYVPPAFREDDPAELKRIIRAARLATLVTATPEGLVATPLPLFLEEDGDGQIVLYGHLAKANPQWKLPAIGEAMVIFSGPDAYVTPLLVRGQARARQGGAHLELRRRARLRAGGVLRG